MPNKERAARRGHTWDAWPCCESPVDESVWYNGRPKRETMCPDCRELIKVGKETLRKAAAAPRSRAETTGGSLNTMSAEPYRVGEEYRVTMVRGWWLQELREEPDWVPVMGPLHDDRDFFALGAFHYHVDPRFLDGLRLAHHSSIDTG